MIHYEFHSKFERESHEQIRERRRSRIGVPAARESGIAIAVGGAAVIGAAASVYGAQQNKKAIASANQANKDSVNDTNTANYRMWLESRGVGANGQAVNVKTPRWMNWNMPGAQRKILGYRPVGSNGAGMTGVAPQQAPVATSSQQPMSFGAALTRLNNARSGVLTS